MGACDRLLSRSKTLRVMYVRASINCLRSRYVDALLGRFGLLAYEVLSVSREMFWQVVVRATSAAHRTPVHHADRCFCTLEGMVDGAYEDYQDGS